MGVHGGCIWGTLDGCTWKHWMGVHGDIGWVYMGTLDGCTWGGHWMGVHGGHWMGVHGGHWMCVHDPCGAFDGCV